MKSPTLKASAFVLVGSAFLLSACGGGGGSGETSAQAASTVTVENSSDVAARGYSSSSSLNNQATNGADAGASLAMGVAINGDKPALIDVSMRHLYRALEVKPANMAVGVSTSETAPCTGGGTLTVAYNGAGGAELANGDSLTITGNECIEAGAKITGTLAITFSNLSGTPSAFANWSATMAMRFTNFVFTENHVTETINGDMTIGFSQASGNQSFSASGNSLQVSTTQGGSTVTETISAYSYTGSATTADLYTYNTSLTVSGNLPRLGNNVLYRVTTLADFKQQGNSNPHQGALKVVATDNTSLTLTVINSTDVQIGIDTNGDGTIDQTLTKTWADLNSLL